MQEINFDLYEFIQNNLNCETTTRKQEKMAKQSLKKLESQIKSFNKNLYFYGINLALPSNFNAEPLFKKAIKYGCYNVGCVLLRQSSMVQKNFNQQKLESSKEDELQNYIIHHCKNNKTKMEILKDYNYIKQCSIMSAANANLHLKDETKNETKTEIKNETIIVPQQQKMQNETGLQR